MNENFVNEKVLIANEKGFIKQVWLDFQSDFENGLPNNGRKQPQNNRERIAFVLENKQVSQFLDNCREFFRAKNILKANKSRLDAFKLVKNEQLQQALITVTQSIIQAPFQGEDNNNTVTLSYWLRASILLKINKPQFAVADLLSAKLLRLDDLFENNEIVEKIEQCEQMLETDKLNRLVIDLLLDKKKNFSTKFAVELLRKLNRPQSFALNANDGVTVYDRAEPNCGMGVAAKIPLKTGDVILVEDPVVACLLPQCFGSHCQTCFCKLIAAVPCQRCSGVAFCSVHCRDEAVSTFHKYECSILNLLMGSGVSGICYLALRSQTEPVPVDKLRNFCTHSEKRNFNDFMLKSLIACFLAKCLEIGKAGKDEGTKNVTEFNETAARILDVLEILQFNVHEIYETQKRTAAADQVRYTALGLYPRASKFNHSCYAEVCRYFDRGRLVLRTLRPFEPDEMIHENYGPSCDQMVLAKRQFQLAQRYWFDCRCVACTENWPLSIQLQNWPTIRLRSSAVDATENAENPMDLVTKSLEVCESNNPKPFLLGNAIDRFYEYAEMPQHQIFRAQKLLRENFARLGNVSELN